MHKHADIAQDTLILDTKIIDDNVSFLVNPKEQIFVEKIIPLLKFGPLSTRYRDIFDLYWLIMNGNLNKSTILNYMNILIFQSDVEIESKEEIVDIINMVLNDTMFINNLSSNNNWTGVSIETITKTINEYIESL